MSIGLRIECLDSVKVIPCGLSDLFALSKRYSQNANSCWECGKANDEESSLKKCAACKVACYCDKQCQTKDWKERHRVWCKAIPEFLKLTKIDYSKYTEDSLTSVTGVCGRHFTSTYLVMIVFLKSIVYLEHVHHEYTFCRRYACDYRLP